MGNKFSIFSFIDGKDMKGLYAERINNKEYDYYWYYNGNYSKVTVTYHKFNILDKKIYDYILYQRDSRRMDYIKVNKVIGLNPNLLQITFESTEKTINIIIGYQL